MHRPLVAVLRAGLRRFLTLLAAAAVVTGLGSLAAGALLGASASRAVSVGFYGVGSFLLVGGFFLGNRGPVRARGEGFPLLGPRFIRRASRAEQEDAIGSSALAVSLGLALVVVGVAVDARSGLF